MEDFRSLKCVYRRQVELGGNNRVFGEPQYPLGSKMAWPRKFLKSLENSPVLQKMNHRMTCLFHILHLPEPGPSMQILYVDILSYAFIHSLGILILHSDNTSSYKTGNPQSSYAPSVEWLRVRIVARIVT